MTQKLQDRRRQGEQRKSKCWTIYLPHEMLASSFSLIPEPYPEPLILRDSGVLTLLIVEMQKERFNKSNEKCCEDYELCIGID